jgi:dTDP-4-amino-4,6-dideoxygalactose transaminase
MRDADPSPPVSSETAKGTKADAGPSYIPFNRFCKVGTEFGYIQQAIDEMHVSGDGRFTASCHALLEQLLGAPKVLLTTSCTHALEMTALLLDVHDGDEIIVPSFTFVSTINAFVLRGARPVFIDIRPDTLNLDETKLERLITSRTRAIVVVHYAGIGCEMDSILEIANRHGVPVIEDNAHGLLGKYRGRNLGTFGCFAAQSFHETKNFTCGEGGALVINQAQYIEQAEIIREKGTNRNRFFRGQVDKYTWVGLGSSYLPSDILAAILYAQLEARETIQARRRRIWENYQSGLKDWALRNDMHLPTVPAHCSQPFHMFYLLMPTEEIRARLIRKLKSWDILSVFHYLPLHLSAMGRRLGGKPAQCPVTESISDRLLRLPFYNDLSESDQDRVIEAITEFNP